MEIIAYTSPKKVICLLEESNEVSSSVIFMDPTVVIIMSLWNYSLGMTT